jgi:spore coat polysaccharide biosynthesis predicted glycosyltransferase SpsG
LAQNCFFSLRGVYSVYSGVFTSKKGAENQVREILHYKPDFIMIDGIAWNKNLVKKISVVAVAKRKEV